MFRLLSFLVYRKFLLILVMIRLTCRSSAMQLLNSNTVYVVALRTGKKTSGNNSHFNIIKFVVKISKHRAQVTCRSSTVWVVKHKVSCLFSTTTVVILWILILFVHCQIQLRQLDYVRCLRLSDQIRFGRVGSDRIRCTRSLLEGYLHFAMTTCNSCNRRSK